MAHTRTAVAHPNIAVVKYWGKRDVALNLPAVPSLSVTLDQFRTRTTVTWGLDAEQDEVVVNDEVLHDQAADRVHAFLDLFGADRPRCRVVSDNNFPTAAGLASSSSAFAALALATNAAAGTDHSLEALSAIARQGSGSACRSLWGGWVEWRMGERAEESVAGADRVDDDRAASPVARTRRETKAAQHNGRLRQRHIERHVAARGVGDQYRSLRRDVGVPCRARHVARRRERHLVRAVERDVRRREDEPRRRAGRHAAGRCFHVVAYGRPEALLLHRI